MSVEVMREIWRHTRAEGTALLLLMAIGDHANGDGEAWPSVASLARKVRLSERQVQRMLKRLLASEELVRVAGAVGRRPATYRVACGKGVTPASTAEGDVVTATSPVEGAMGDTHVTGPVAAGVTSASRRGDVAGGAYKEVEPSKNPQVDMGREIQESPPVSLPPGLAAFDAELRHCRGYDPDEGFYRKVREKYSRLDLEEVAIQIRGWLEDPRHKRRVCSRGFVLAWLGREVGGQGPGRWGGAEVRRPGDTGSGRRVDEGGKSGEWVRRSDGYGRNKDLGGAAGLEKFG